MLEILLEQLLYRCPIWFDKFSTYLNDYVSLQRISFGNRQKRKIHIQSHYKAHAAITVIHCNSHAAITVIHYKAHAAITVIHYKAYAAITVIHYNSQAAITVMRISQYIEV